MTSITREALCRNEFCPEPRNPEWHACIVCGNPQVEHAHVIARSRAPARRLDRKGNVVALCHKHHELQTLNKWAFHEQRLPFGGLVHQWLTDERGATVWKRDVGVSSATDEAAPSGTGEKPGSPSSVAPGASSDGGKETRQARGNASIGAESVGAAVVATSLPPSPDAGADSRGRSTLPVPNPVTRSSAGVAGGQEVGTLPTPAPIQSQEDNDGGISSSINRRGYRSDTSHVSQSLVGRLTPAPISESLKSNGLDLPAEFTFEEWTDLAGMVAGMNKNRQWWAGDLVLAGERFGERATNFWNDLGYRWESLSNAVRVCRRFPLQSGLRRPELSFAHHAVVYAQDDDEVMDLLDLADAEGWTVKQLREAVHGVKPKTVRYTLSELREALAAWPGEPKVRNNARRWAEAWLDSLEAR